MTIADRSRDQLSEYCNQSSVSLLDNDWYGITVPCIIRISANICPITQNASRTASVLSRINATCVCNKVDNRFLNLKLKKIIHQNYSDTTRIKQGACKYQRYIKHDGLFISFAAKRSLFFYLCDL